MRLSRTFSLILSLILLLTVSAVGVYAAGTGSVTTQDIDLTLLSCGEYCNVYFDPDFEDKLTENESKLYAILAEKLPLGEGTIDISDCGYTDTAVLADFLQKVLNTELPFVRVSDTLAAVITDGVITQLRFTFAHSVRAFRSAAFASVEEAVEHALNSVSDVTTDLEKALLLHEYIVRETDYNLDVINGEDVPVSSPLFTLEGVLLNRDAVCQGYAEAYSYLLKEVGIASCIVASDAMDHAWNMINIDGSWYHVDCTWDDPSDRYEVDFCRGGFVTHGNFLRSDIEMEDICDHYEWFLLTGEEELPAATTEDRFAGYCFRPIKKDNDGYTDVGCISYVDGYYYALSTNYGSDILRKSKIDGSELELIQLARTYKYMFYYDGYLYANDASYVYELNMDGTEKRIVVAASGTIENFWLKMDTFGYYEVDTEGNAYRRVVDLSTNPDNIVEKDGMVFILDTAAKTAALAGYKGTASDLVIPAEVDGCRVISVKSYAITGADSVRSIVLPDTVVELCDYALFKTKLTKLQLSSSLKRIGKYAVYNNWYLTKIDIPASVNEIGKQAFAYCWNLTDVTFEGTVPENWGEDIFTTEFEKGYVLPTLHFTYGVKGWTSPTWKDKYGVVYNTKTDIPLYKISGSITSYGDPEEPVTIFVFDKENKEIDKLITAKGEYSFSLPEGQYVLEIRKANHVTRQYSISIGK